MGRWFVSRIYESPGAFLILTLTGTLLLDQQALRYGYLSPVGFRYVFGLELIVFLWGVVWLRTRIRKHDQALTVDERAMIDVRRKRRLRSGILNCKILLAVSLIATLLGWLDVKEALIFRLLGLGFELFWVVFLVFSIRNMQRSLGHLERTFPRPDDAR